MTRASLAAGPTNAASTAAATGSHAPVVPRSAAVSQAAETRRLYAADWTAFSTWCRDRRLAALPAQPATVAAYLRSLAATLSHGTLARRAAAITGQHRRAGHASPGTDPDVRDVLRIARAAKRAKREAAVASPLAPPSKTPARGKPPPSPAQLTRIAARCLGDLAGLRDRALLLLTAAGLDAERLLALDREHVRLTGQGVELAVRGTDGTDGRRLTLTRIAASAACPVHALETWLHNSDTRFGPVFRKVNRWGAVEHNRLRPDGLRRIWQRRAKAVRADRAKEMAKGHHAAARDLTAEEHLRTVSPAWDIRTSEHGEDLGA